MIPAPFRVATTVVCVENSKQAPASYGYYGLFLGTVAIVCGVLVKNAMFFGLGAASLVFGLAYTLVLRKRPRG